MLNSFQPSILFAELTRSYVMRHGLKESGVSYADKTYASVQDYAVAYRSKKTTPSAVMRASMTKVKEWEKDGWFVFSSINEPDVLAQAAASDKRIANGQSLSILDGVPIAFKDMLGVDGHSIYAGKDPNRSWNFTSRGDDPVVARFREAGAIIFGVTIMTEGGTTPLGYNAFFKGPFNPYSKQHFSGGSSSGSAAAVAMGIVPIAIGFDGGGSIRIPAAVSGVLGLACTFGRIPFKGPTGSTMIKGGPMAHSAADTALGYMVMTASSEDPNEFYRKLYDGGVKGTPHPNLAGFPEAASLKGMRIGVFNDWFMDVDKSVSNLYTSMVIQLRELGAEVVVFEIPHLRWLAMSHGIKISTEFAMEWDLLHHTRLADMEPNTRVSIAIGSTASALEVIAADRMRAWALNYTTELFQRQRLDAIINPTVGFTAPVLHDAYKKHGVSDSAMVMKMMKQIFLANLLGLPAISIPIGFSKCPETGTKLPLGLQFTANHWKENILLQIANVFEKSLKRDDSVKPVHFIHPINNAIDVK
jgi:Asp-tRNA(Asn)/Glu-tRNA(Gln) amidotransferase A subunit family amidase